MESLGLHRSQNLVSIDTKGFLHSLISILEISYGDQ